MPVALVAALIVFAIAGCGQERVHHAGTKRAEVRPAVLWPAPSDPLDRVAAAGLRPERREFLVNHFHAHLDVFVDGRPVTVPAGIGIQTKDPEVKRFDEPGGVVFGGIERCRRPCISPLHTHDGSGIIHTESKRPEPNTLGQFLAEWGVSLGASCLGGHCSSEGIALYVDGRRYRQDPRALKLVDGEEIAIVVGRPPRTIPKTADFSRA